MEESIHEALKPIVWLSGRWFSEEGKGKYPTISEFAYHEVMEFKCVGQPMFNFLSTSHHPVKRTPMHQERGFLRIKPGTNEVAFVVSHNFGLTTIEEGLYNPETKELRLKSTSVNRISFAKPPKVTATERLFKYVAPDAIEITLSMETEDTPMTEHLKVLYHRLG